MRDRVALLCAYTTVAALALVFVFSKGTQFLMPGPLTSAHGAIEACGTCHTKNGSGKLSWLHGLVAGDSQADSKACLSCHNMPDTALNPHGASRDLLKRNTERLMKVAASSHPPLTLRAQNRIFPTRDIAAGDLSCATCHQEHLSGDVAPAKLTNAQCQSCHAAQFASFESGHPKFESYPFKRRTRIVYDHAAHFDKHYPEVAKKDAARRIPRACSTCHTSGGDHRVMKLATFEETCAACHSDQITGKERVSGPKGIAFLSLPGLDLEALKKKSAALGEWPVGSEAALSPFTALMISRTEKGRALVKAVNGLNLQDLSQASDDQIRAVAELGWEIKKLVFALVTGEASDALGGIRLDRGGQSNGVLAADLSASLPRDVVVSAQQQWLPNLAAEMEKGPGATASPAAAAAQPSTEPPEPTQAAPQASVPAEVPAEAAKSETSGGANPVKRDPPACLVRVFGQCLVTNDPKGPGDVTPSQGLASDSDTARREPPGAMRAGLTSVGPAIHMAQSTPAGGSKRATDEAGATASTKAPKKSDELLFPTAEERREIDAHNKASGKKTGPAGGVAGAQGSNAAASGPPGQPPAGLGKASDVDPESWAEYGGWYYQDFAIFYRPTGHKDRFVTSWLTLTGPQASNGAASPPAAIFGSLTHKDAQGSCTKCHSVDAAPGKGKRVNFSPVTVEQKTGSFTRFVHEPHFRVVGDRGCVACHELEKGRPYLKSYEQGDPHVFAAQFSDVSKDRCQSCHSSGKARQDCLLCHAYHVNGVITPITDTRLPGP